MTYSYSSPVRLLPHLLRLKPRLSPTQTLHHFNLIIDPLPTKIYETAETDGSIALHLHFAGLTEKLTIQMDSIVSSLSPELEPNAPIKIPYNPLQYKALSPFIDPGSLHPDIRALANQMKPTEPVDWILHLSLVAQKLFKEIAKDYREFGWPHPAEYTFEQKKGSCRDVSVLMMSLTRQWGVATRFVSGYVFDPTLSASQGELHAWVECFLPPLGWVGFDPSYGELCGQNYVPICTSCSPELCTPLEGQFEGSANSTLTTTVSILKG